MTYKAYYDPKDKQYPVKYKPYYDPKTTTSVEKSPDTVSQARREQAQREYDDANAYKSADSGVAYEPGPYTAENPTGGTPTSFNPYAKNQGRRGRPEWDTQWKSFTFELIHGKDIQTLTLFINPEQFQQIEPAKASVTITKGGKFVDHFGAGTKTIVLAGNTGFKGDIMKGGKESGQAHFMKLRKMYRDWLDGATDLVNPAEMRFHNWSDNESYVVVINNFTLQRAANRTLLYQYNMQMTIINALDEKNILNAKAADVTDSIGSTSRYQKFYDKLSSATEFFDTLSDSFDNLSTTMQGFSTLYDKGLEFYNVATATYVTVASIVDDVNDIARDINRVVTGVTAFVTQPFDLVTSAADSIENICDALSSFIDVPHEAIRHFRDMQCTLMALPEAMFKGFTNPELFEGASNCGTTMGIEEAAVAGYRNSFSATAQLPAEREVTQTFSAPTEILTVKEDPVKVTGVFLESDIERLGTNYFESFSGNQITISSIPTVPVTVVYSVEQATTTGLLQLETASAYVVQTGDTAQRIALLFYGDASRWKEIVVYNDLEYPYFTDDLEFEHEVHATGTVRFYRLAGVTGNITIPVDTRVYVPPYQGTKAIYFDVTATTVLPLAQTYIDVPVEAILSGTIGNIAPNVLTGHGVVKNTIAGVDIYYRCILAHTSSDATEPGVGASWATYWVVDANRTGADWETDTYYPVPIAGVKSITNLSPTTGGLIWDVATPGDIIFIPQSAGEKVKSAVTSAGKTYDELFGVDIKLNKWGEIDTGAEENVDTARVSGVDNLKQALENRLKTSRSFYPYNATYGTNIPLYVGQRGTYHWFSRLKKEVVFTMLDDSRLKEVDNLKMVISGDLVVIDFNAVTIAEQSNLPINLMI